MRPSPYRSPWKPEASIEAAPEDCPDRDLAVVFFVLWLGSVVRVALGISEHETFRTEATLAFLAVILLPVVLRGTVAWLFRRCVGRVVRGRR